MTTSEHDRLADNAQAWKQWGCYLSDRAWATVREDYSADGDVWNSFPFDHAQSKAYRWGEDGLAGISDDKQYLCFAIALWNGNDTILKERLFGLTGEEGNHGEDVKEYYFYVDNTPTHSYMHMQYKYPQGEFPYSALLFENARRGYEHDEYELLDTGVFDDDRYFDVDVEYAKQAPDDILIRISISNRYHDVAICHLLPTLWFRNTWSWGYETSPMKDVPEKPQLSLVDHDVIQAVHPVLGRYYLYSRDSTMTLFTENETNTQRLYGVPNASPYVKDAFHRYVIHGEFNRVNHSQQRGTKAAPLYRLEIAGGATEVITLRLTTRQFKRPFQGFDRAFDRARQAADDFYASIHAAHLDDQQKQVQRQALAGLLWTKQLYYYDVDQWLAGDPIHKPPSARKRGRNSDWQHLNNFDILSMPDKWEYPWYAVWDSAFHCIPLAMVDLAFAKEQLLVFTHEWYMHPNGQIPAYEWQFDDVNPPVHAWAAMHVYEMEYAQTGNKDTTFLKRIFNKMMLNFTWWVNRKDPDGNNIFQGGFLGLDNISIFDRSSALPTGGKINQSDGTAWMGFYCLVMMNIAIELARTDLAYQDMAIKFYEHFLWIAVAISGETHDGIGLWDERDGFFYDVLQLPDGSTVPLRVRSLVGLMPLIAVETVGQPTLDALPDFWRSINWLRTHREHLTQNLAVMEVEGYGNAKIFAMPTKERLLSCLRYMLDEDEFLSPYGIRSLSKYHETHPYSITFGNETFHIEYWAAESRSGLFGGNSNWRGPVWFPINYLLIEALRKYHRFYKDEDLRVECPTGSGNYMTLDQVADELSRRLSRLFLPDADGRRPIYGAVDRLQNDPHWRDKLLFFEYFNGDNGAGLGASHQTGWTGLVAELLNTTAKA